MSDSLQPRIAALYTGSSQTSKDVLKTFAKDLLSQGVLVHGLLQENILDAHGVRMGVDAIDIHTQNRIELMRPSPYERKHKKCSLNLAQLSEATRILRRAVDEKADIVLVERYSKTESDGGGLADDLLNLMASGIPTVVSVLEDERAAWLRYCGGLADTIDCHQDALINWWNANAH